MPPFTASHDPYATPIDRPSEPLTVEEHLQRGRIAMAKAESALVDGAYERSAAWGNLSTAHFAAAHRDAQVARVRYTVVFENVWSLHRADCQHLRRVGVDTNTETFEAPDLGAARAYVLDELAGDDPAAGIETALHEAPCLTSMR